MRISLSARPSLTLVLLTSPGMSGLEQLLADVLPSCREYEVELLVVGGASRPDRAWEEEHVRHLPSGPGETEIDLRSRAMGEATGDIVLFVTAAEAALLDVVALLGHRAGIVSLELPEGQEAPTSAGHSVG